MFESERRSRIHPFDRNGAKVNRFQRYRSGLGGFEIAGIDLACTEPSDIEQFRQMLYSAGLIRFRDVDITEADQVKFARSFGPLSELDSQFHGQDLRYSTSNTSTTFFTTSESGYGTVEIDFHQEYGYAVHRPRYVILYAIDAPSSGGETRFADAAQVLDRLPEEVVHTLRASQVRNTSPANGTTVVIPAIERHPVTSRSYITVNRLLTTELIGRSGLDSPGLMKTVFDCLYDEKYVFSHQWRVGDLLIWDNHVLQHGRAPVDARQPRELRRCMVADDWGRTAVHKS